MPNASIDQADVIAFLSDPATYGRDCEGVEIHETHGAVVFLAGERAYKLKRAVHYPYMDYSTPAIRAAMCKAELTVNRRTAPDLYLEVLSIVRMKTGRLRLGAEDEGGEAIDCVVVMRRFAQADLLEERRKRGTLEPSVMLALGEAVARFHAAAEVSPQWGGAAGIARVIDENVRMFRQFAGSPFDPAKTAEYEQRSRTTFGAFSAALEARRRAGWVRRCHGDLHLNNICMINGAPLLFDAIEFNDDFSCIDVYFDLAFILMDLHRHGLDTFANALFNRYVETTGDLGLQPLPLFLSCRAAIRAHVAAAGAAQGADRTDRLREANELLALSLRLLEPMAPTLIAIGGFSGSGKSTVAAALAPSLGRVPGAVVLRSDVIRKRLFGVDRNDRLPAEAYSAAASDLIYREMIETAEAVLTAGQSVIVDAVFGQPSERSAIRAMATRLETDFQGLWLDAPVDCLSRRIATRTGDVSDATDDVLRRQVATLRRPDDWNVVDASGSVHAVTLAAQQILGIAPP